MSNPVQDCFGNYYRLIADKSKFSFVTTNAMSFTDIESAKRFLTSLSANDSYWLVLLNELGLSPILGQPVEEHIATSLFIGSLNAHPVPAYDPKEDISKRSFKDSSGKSLTLANPQSAEAIQSNNIKKVTNVNEAKKLVLQMDLKSKEVIKIFESTAVAKDPNRPSDDMEQCLAESIACGEVVFIEKMGPKRKTEAVEEFVSVVVAQEIDQCEAEQQSEPVEQEVDHVCELQKFIVSCSHDGRKQEMTTDSPGILSLDVVASPTKSRGFEKITAKMIANAPCGDHNPSSSSIQPASECVDKSAGQNVYTLASDPITNPLKLLWLPSIKPKTYKISPNCCNRFNPSAVEVNVFPKIAWNISVAYGVGGQEYSAKQDKAGKIDDKQEGKAGGFTGKVEVAYDDSKKDLTLDYKTSIDSILTKLNWVQRKVDKVLQKLSSKGPVKLEVFWPSFSIKYNAEIKEDKGPEVVSTYGLSVAADPLIGLKGSIDAFPALLKAARANPAAASIAKILELAMEGVGSEEGVASFQADIQLVFSVETKVTIKFDTSGTNGRDEGEAKSEQAINMDFQFEGLVGVKGHVWVIKFEKSYKAGIKTGFVGKLIIQRDDVGYFWYSRFLFNGIIVYFTKYEKLEKTVTGNNRIFKESLKRVPDTIVESETTEWVWVEPDPDEGAPSDTDSAAGNASTLANNRSYLIEF